MRSGEKDPLDPTTDYVKRFVGLPGDTIEDVGGTLDGYSPGWAMTVTGAELFNVVPFPSSPQRL